MSVTSLYRSARAVYIGGRVQAPRDLTNIIGGILAVNSVEIQSVIGHVKKYDSIDIGCSINKFAFHVRRSTDRRFQTLVSSKQTETVLSFFYLILNELYKLGTVAGIDIRDYADATLDGLTLERGEV